MSVTAKTRDGVDFVLGMSLFCYESSVWKNIESEIKEYKTSPETHSLIEHAGVFILVNKEEKDFIVIKDPFLIINFWSSREAFIKEKILYLKTNIENNTKELQKWEEKLCRP